MTFLVIFTGYTLGLPHHGDITFLILYVGICFVGGAIYLISQVPFSFVYCQSLAMLALLSLRRQVDRTQSLPSFDPALSVE